VTFEINLGQPVLTSTATVRIESRFVLDPNRTQPACTVWLVLPFDRRNVSRQLVTLSDGREAGLFLPRGTVLRGGDMLQTTMGELIGVQAADEAVLRVTASDVVTLMRATYHLGNRHVPVQVGDGFVQLEYDYVLKDMLVRLGVTVTEQMSPFEPEAGAYGGGHRHSHD
jgi:urease accessory protein